MSLLIKNGTLIPLQDDTVIEAGWVGINGRVIDYVGQAGGVSEKRYDEIIDAQGMLVLPGFINMHCHLFQVLLKSAGPDMRLVDWLKNTIWPVVGNLSYEEIYNAAVLGIIENIKSGVTTVVDMNYGNRYPEAVLSAFASTKIRGYLSRGFYEIESIDRLEEKKESVLDSIEKLFEKHENVFPGPMHPCNVTNELLLATKKLCAGYKRKFYIHIAESREDIALLVSREGKRDVELMSALGVLDENFIGIHTCNLTEAEIKMLGEAKAHAVHCPTSNMYIADGVAPIIELKNSGANVCLGTDGAASTGKLDFFSEMKTAALLQKVFRNDPSYITAYDVLKMAAPNGAHALGIKSGVLMRGNNADIILLDVNSVNTVYSEDPLATLVYSANPENVDTVIVDGNVLMRKRKLCFINEQEYLDKVRKKGESIRKSQTPPV